MDAPEGVYPKIDDLLDARKHRRTMGLWFRVLILRLSDVKR